MARIYAVESETELTMVKANSQAQALSHVAKNQYKVKTATAMDVVEYMQQGGEVEDATGEKEPTTHEPEATNGDGGE